MTIRVDIEETVERPVEEVFARLADIDGYPEWLPRSGIYRGGCLVDPDETVQVGTKFHDDTVFGRFRGRVTVFDRPNRIEFRQTLQLGASVCSIHFPAIPSRRSTAGRVSITTGRPGHTAL